jgi:hypothetical protein
MVMQAKYCRKCKQLKPLSEFNRHATAADGLRSMCKRCDYESFDAWRRANIVRRRELQNEYERKQSVRRRKNEAKRINRARRKTAALIASRGME